MLNAFLDLVGDANRQAGHVRRRAAKPRCRGRGRQQDRRASVDRSPFAPWTIAPRSISRFRPISRRSSLRTPRSRRTTRASTIGGQSEGPYAGTASLPEGERRSEDRLAGSNGRESSCIRATNFQSMLRDCEEVFRFIWENREPFKIDGQRLRSRELVARRRGPVPTGSCYTRRSPSTGRSRESSARRSRRYSGCDRPDGMTVAPGDHGLRRRHTRFSTNMAASSTTYATRCSIPERQGARLEFLWRSGYFERSQQVRSRFSFDPPGIARSP